MCRGVLDISAALSNVEHVVGDDGTRPNAMLLDGMPYALSTSRMFLAFEINDSEHRFT